MRVRTALLMALPLLLFLQLLLWHVYLPAALAGGTDFSCFYAAGQRVRAGQGHQLYQPLPSVAPYIHLAYEAIGFAPFAGLKFRTAYLAFLMVNLIMLIGALALLLRCADSSDWRLAAIVAAGFLPISFAVVRGQDSLAVLLLLSAAAYFLATEKEFAAGIMLGLGLFRLQIVLPIALLFFVWHRWKVVRGFAVSALLVLAASMALVGPAEFVGYRKILLSLSFAAPLAANFVQFPGDMANLRGLVMSLAGNGPGSKIAVLVLSAAVMLWAAHRKPRNGPRALVLATVVAALVSYHGYAHDFSIMILPILLVLLEENTILAHSAAVLLATSTALWIWPGHAFLIALPLLAFMILCPSGNQPLWSRGSDHDRNIQEAGVSTHARN